MSVPVLAASATAQDDSTVFSVNVPLPANVAAGDLLFLFTRDGFGTSNAPASGWTTQKSDVFGTDDRTQIYTRVATGGEGATVTCPTSGGGFVAITSRVTNYDSNAGTYLFISSSNNTTDPPVLTPAAGLRDYLWILFGSVVGSSDPSSTPGSTDGDTFLSETSVKNPTNQGSRCSACLFKLAKRDDSLDPTNLVMGAGTFEVIYTIAVLGPVDPVVLPQVPIPTTFPVRYTN